MLDSTPPTVQVLAEGSRGGKTEVTISWSGVDALIGVASYDVQYRDGEGPWVDWLTRTNLTTSIYVGGFGHTYCFRARASDRVGNEAAFPEDEGAFARVTVPEPVRFIEGSVFALLVIVIIVVAVAAAAAAAGYYMWRRRAAG